MADESLSIDETVALLRQHAFQEYGGEDGEVLTGRTLIHSRLGGIGADWDLADAVAFAEKAHWRGWVDSLVGHNLGIEVHDGDRVRLVCFAVLRPKDDERDALQKAYNGICGVLASLGEAGWATSALAGEVEAIRVQLAKVAFDAVA